MLRVWNLASPASSVVPFMALPGHEGRILSVTRITPDIFASAGEDGTIRVWRLSSGECLQTMVHEGEADVTSVVALSRELLCSSSWDNTVRIWRVATGELVSTVDLEHRVWCAAALSPRLLVTGCGDRIIRSVGERKKPSKKK